MWPHYFPFMGRLYRVLAAMQLALCSACFRYRYRHIVNEHPILLGRGGGLTNSEFHHHAGHVQVLLDSGSPIPSEAMQRWFYDREHGLFHGLCTAIMGAMSVLDRVITTEALIEQFKSADPWASKYFTSAILHDFCRGGMGMGAGHDVALAEFFPHMLPETYEHSSPSPAHENKPLILGDRLELLRFAGYESWVDDEKMQQLRHDCNPQFVNIFYRCVRPALELLFFHENEVWLRHGLENRAKSIRLKDHNWAKQRYPQVGSFHNVRDRAGEDGFSVEISRGGLSQCVEHGAQYVHIQGVIPAKHFMEHGGVVRHCDTDQAPYKTYDHVCGVGDTPLSAWVFHYHEPLHASAPYTPHATQVDGLYKENPYRDCLQPMFENGALLIPSNIARTWRHIVDQWRVRLELLRVYSRGSYQ